MFRDATRLARGYTRPVVASWRDASGRVGSSVGSFVVLNEAGWIVTSAHVFDAPARPAPEGSEAAQAMDTASPGDRSDASRPAPHDRITARSWWWGRDGVALVDRTIVAEADLAVGRLDPFPPDLVQGVPVFLDPIAPTEPGTSLCRLGFPFAHVPTTHDTVTGHFAMTRPQLVFFPNEGILTRLIDGGHTTDGAHPILALETSSPGLRGQSGGPVYDRKGRIWGIQSRTVHLPLGFDPTIVVDGRRTVEHQFLNLGVATHARTVLSVLSAMGVPVEVAAGD